MATRRKPASPPPDGVASPMPSAASAGLFDSAMAGFGALSKAQAEGGRLFEALVSDVQAKAAQPWDKLENIFEQRVQKALLRLGVPAFAEFAALQQRVAALELRLAGAAAPAAAVKAAPSVVKPAVKPAVKAPARAPASRRKSAGKDPQQR